MAHESFEDEEVAETLNRDFVAVKVDKEERPDVDAVYMSVCLALNGHGGWPLTILMTPDRKPFFAGTYLPKQAKQGMQGLLEILGAVKDLWRNDRDSLVRSGDSIVEFLKGREEQGIDRDEYGELDAETLRAAAKEFAQSFDSKYGGFGRAPKFPSPHNLMFLLRQSVLGEDAHALKMVEKTLTSMYRGGIFDHIGYGFSRYSTDSRWLAPHFEKMLYDNALLAIAYLEAYQVTDNMLYRQVAEQTLLYIGREMTSPEGAFYSAQDADSEGVEGRYYLVSPDEVIRVAGEEAGEAFCKRYDITKKGNFEGLSIPNLIRNDEYKETPEQVVRILPDLREYRQNRYRLHKDDKILTAWNALMIVAYAKAYQVTGVPEYLGTARKAMHFIEGNLIDDAGTVYVGYREGRNTIRGFLDDYAFLAWAYLACYEAAFDAADLEKCVRLTEKMSFLFEDEEGGGYYLYSAESESLIARPKETYDGAMPSGNSVAAYVLNRVSDLTGNTGISERADRQMDFMARSAGDSPSSHTFSLIAAMSRIYPASQLVCVLPDDGDMSELRSELGKRFLPNTAVLVKTSRNEQLLSRIAAYVQDHSAKDGKPTYYLCRNYSCSAPTHSLEKVLKAIAK